MISSVIFLTFAPTSASADHIEQRAVSDGWDQAQVQVSSAWEWLKWLRSHHPKGVPQPLPRHHLDLAQTELHHWEGPGRCRPDCRGEGGAVVGGSLSAGSEREGEGGVGGVGRVRLAGALPLPHSHHGRRQKLLSLTFCSSNFHSHFPP